MKLITFSQCIWWRNIGSRIVGLLIVSAAAHSCLPATVVAVLYAPTACQAVTVAMGYCEASRSMWRLEYIISPEFSCNV